MKAKELTEKSFKDYGWVTSRHKTPPDAQNGEFVYSAGLCGYSIEGNVMVSLLEGLKRPMVLERMERHKQTEELLAQLRGDGVLFLAKADDAEAVPGAISAFIMKEGDSVVMKKGVWHWVPFPMGETSCLTQVVFRQGTSEEDGEVVMLPEKISL